MLAAECGLRAIEWGADVHVKPGDASAIRRARAAADSVGCRCASYGSYLFADGVPDRYDVLTVLDTAAALGAATVRVWAGFGIEAGTTGFADLVGAMGDACDDA